MITVNKENVEVNGKEDDIVLEFVTLYYLMDKEYPELLELALEFIQENSESDIKFVKRGDE